MKSRKEEILALLQKNETGLTAGAVADVLLSIQCQQSMKENKSM